MGKQTHILCLSPVFQAVMGYGLKLRGLQLDLYAFFKQGSVFQICGRTSSKRTCVRGGQHTTLHCSSLGTLSELWLGQEFWSTSVWNCSLGVFCDSLTRQTPWKTVLVPAYLFGLIYY